MLKDKTQMDRQRRLAESQSKQVRMEPPPHLGSGSTAACLSVQLRQVD